LGSRRCRWRPESASIRRGGKIAANLGRSDVAPDQSHSFRTINLMVANDGWVADPCQGRQPPEGGGRRPAFTGVRHPATIDTRGLMNGARHVHVEREWFWVDSYVTARQRMQTWLRIEPLWPVIYLRPMSPAGRCLSAMRSWPDILWSGLCSGGPAPQPEGSAPPIPIDRSRAPDACRSEPRASRPTPLRDGSGSHSQPTGRNAARCCNGGTTTRHDRLQAGNCLLSLRQFCLRQGAAVANSSTAPLPGR
jgi:hypothetical protein